MYYVTTTASGQGCPSTHQQYCNPLSYYCSLAPDQWSPNTTLIFLPGVHDCGTGGIEIQGANQLVLSGQLIDSKVPVIKSKEMNFYDVGYVFIDKLELQIHHVFIYDAIIAVINDISALRLTVFRGTSIKITNSEFVANQSAAFAVEIKKIKSSILLQDLFVLNTNGHGLTLNPINKCICITINNALIASRNFNGEGLIVDIPIDTSSCLESNVCYVNMNNITLANCTLAGGIYNAENITLTDVKIFQSFMGFQLFTNGKFITVNGFYAYLAGNAFVIVENGCFITLSNITIVKSVKAIQFLRNCGYISVTNVTISDMMYVGLYIGHGKSVSLSNILVTRSNGGLYLDNIMDVVTLSNLTITNNSNSGIRASGKMNLKFSNHPSTISNNNSPGNGGGMWISERVTLFSNTAVLFSNNTAKEVGGAIYSSVDLGVSLYEEKPCTLAVFEDFFMPRFLNNTGGFGGDNVYGGQYWNCCDGVANFDQNCAYDTSLSLKDSFIERLYCFDNKLFKWFQQKPISSLVTSRPLGVCICNEDSAINCSTRSVDRLIYPGQSISLSLATVGVCGGISPGELVTSNSSMTEVVLLNVSQATSGRNCIKFGYRLYSQFSNGSIFLRHATNPGEARLANSSLMINVTFLPCPVGLTLSSKACQCNNVIESINGTQCSIDWMPHPIRRSGNNWLSYNQQYNCTVAHKNCPFDYCNTSAVYLNLTHPDLQCTNGRSGTFCGECQTGLSLTLGSNKCESCNNKYLSIVVAFIVAGIALVVFLLGCNLTVSVGSINGLLFYANMIKLNESALFPNGVSIPVLSQFIAWLNLDLGIKTCFFNGLDGYWKTWLQFGYSLTLIATIIVCCKFSSKLSRLFGRNVVSVLSTLIFMAHSKLLLAIRNALMIAIIKCGDRQWYVWSIDGNIDYFSSKHLPLIGFALFMMLIGLVYTLSIFCSQWMMRFCGRHCRSSWDPFYRFKPFIDPYTGPYKDKYRYWTGLLLIERLLVATVFSYTTGTVPQLNSYVIMIIAFTTLFLSRGVYRSKKLNLLEYFYLFNLGLVSVLNALSDHMVFGYYVVITVTGVSVGLSLITFLGTVIVHIYIALKGRFNKCFKGKRSEEEEGHLPEGNVTNETEMYSPADFVIEREPLIFELDT